MLARGGVQRQSLGPDALAETGVRRRNFEESKWRSTRIVIVDSRLLSEQDANVCSRNKGDYSG